MPCDIPCASNGGKNMKRMNSPSLTLALALALIPANVMAGETTTTPASTAAATTPASSAAATTALTSTIDHAAFDALLRAHVKGPRVDYAGFATNAAFAKYVDAIGTFNPATLTSRADRLAFYINAYNALTISGVLKHLPGLKSVEAVYPDFGFFKRADFKVGGKAMSLNNLEHDIIRPEFNDPRVHAALNCASVSCPPLLAEAYVPTKVEAQLEKQMKAFVLDSARNQIDATKGVKLSMIFDWFSKDFKARGGVVTFMSKYLSTEQAATLSSSMTAGKVTYLPYDWNLNKL